MQPKIIALTVIFIELFVFNAIYKDQEKTTLSYVVILIIAVCTWAIITNYDNIKTAFTKKEQPPKKKKK